MSEQRWLIEQVTGRFEQVCDQAQTILSDKEEAAANALKEILASRAQSPVVRVTFVGQYSAGKSTVITALTGDRTIKIDADIATDRTTDYSWNGISVTDTPGLWTERKEHDAITEKAIREADLLVFVITSDLFNTVTLRNFKKLAFEQSYQHKVMLVVNKMSMEEGSYSELRDNYAASLGDGLSPHRLSDFRVAFIDAADYLNSGGDAELLALSHFGDFIAMLNRFVAERGLMGRLDQPVREALHVVENAQVQAGASEESRIYFTLLQRVETRVQRSMRQSQQHVDSMMAQLRNDIVALGSRLAGMIGQEGADVAGEAHRAETEVTRLADGAGGRLAALLEEERQKLDGELHELFASELAEAYFERVRRSGALSGANVEAPGAATMRKNFDALNSLTSQLSAGVSKLMGTEVAGFYSATTAAGSGMHQVVYNVGKFFGASFKPWQAVNIAKTIGNVAKVAGVIFAVISVVADGYQLFKENEHEQKVREARGDCRNSFITLAQDLRQQFQEKFDEYKHAFYLPALQKISEQRQEAVDNQSRLSEYQQQLGTVIGELRELTKLIATGEDQQPTV